MKSKIQSIKPAITELEVEYATGAALNEWSEKCYKLIMLTPIFKNL